MLLAWNAKHLNRTLWPKSKLLAIHKAVENTATIYLTVMMQWAVYQIFSRFFILEVYAQF